MKPSETPLTRVGVRLRDELTGARLFALDVDGVLTDGSIAYTGDQETQTFHVHDGAGLVWLIRAGLRVVWITGRGCASTERRARELGCELFTKVRDKRAKLEELCAKFGIERAATLAMGDDLPDLGLAAAAGCFFAPADARPEVRDRADHVTLARGGRGAVREVCEIVLTARGEWTGRVERAGS